MDGFQVCSGISDDLSPRPTLFCSVFAKQQTWFMFESRVLETEQGNYQIGCGMTLPEALWWDTVCPAHLSWRKYASLQARCRGAGEPLLLHFWVLDQDLQELPSGLHWEKGRCQGGPNREY